MSGLGRYDLYNGAVGSGLYVCKEEWMTCIRDIASRDGDGRSEQKTPAAWARARIHLETRKYMGYLRGAWQYKVGS